MMPASFVAQYTAHAPARTGTRHNFVVPYGSYRVGDGSSVNLAVQNDGQWHRLCAIVLRQPTLADDPRFVSNELRLKHRDELEPLIESLLADATRSSVEARLIDADVPFGTVNRVQDVADHPQLAARGRWFDIDSPVGELRAFHHPMNIVGLARPAMRVPALGEHTREVLEELGL
jgi:crotonobetainyl-CoA:carnitine CoA-transferase CaiB-like acyl-CoA transferase